MKNWFVPRTDRNDEGSRRPSFPIAQASNNPRYPVFFYKAYRRHCLTAINNPESPFYLAINHKPKPSDTVWFMNAPLGKNSIGTFLKMAAKRTGLQWNVTNQPVRKTSVGRLLDADVPASYVAQLSGRKNLRSLDSYKSASTSPAQNVTRIEPLRANGTHHQHHDKQRACNIYSICQYNQAQASVSSYFLSALAAS